MKKIKLFLLSFVICILTVAMAFSACGTGEKQGGTGNDGPFFNPGDSLGGGGTGDVAGEADSSANDGGKKKQFNPFHKNTSFYLIERGFLISSNA